MKDWGSQLSFRWAAELLLWAVAVVCLGATALAAIAALNTCRRAQKIIPATKSVASRNDAPAQAAQRRAINAAEVIGRIDIPELGLSAPITSGIASSSLLRGVGHIDGTAMPGGLGTLGLAGHRDTYLRSLQRIKVGMDIQVIDQSGTYHYRVDSTEIVMPQRVDVLAIRSRPELALITCYPFQFIGAAPKRFIVHAHLLSASPDVSVKFSL